MAETTCSIIITCKGRLEHLKRSLPTVITQQASEVIVVDYDCPDGTAAWLAENYPQIRVVKVESAPVFHPAHAHNIGAAAASANWLFFVDADILLAGHVLSSLAPLLESGCFYRPLPVRRQIWGTVVVARDDFDRLGGYDEVIKGYGGEDDDFFFRLTLLGARQTGFPAEWLSEIPHEDALRGRFHATSNIRLSQRANSLYAVAKADVRRLIGRPLSQDERQKLFNEAWQAVDLAGERGKSLLDVTLPAEAHVPIQRGWRLSRRVVLTLTPSEDTPANRS